MTEPTEADLLRDELQAIELERARLRDLLDAIRQVINTYDRFSADVVPMKD